MTRQQQDDATFKAVLILIDSLSAGARALLRNRLVEEGVAPPQREGPARKPKR